MYIKGCTTEAIDNAAGNGHLAVVQYLTNKQKSCTGEALAKAAKTGHLDVVKYLVAHRTEGITREGVNATIANGLVDVVMYLISKGNDIPFDE
eukprot:Pgem_evm1s11031